MNMKRIWTPKVGDTVKMKAFWQYTELPNDVDGNPSPGVWAHLVVKAIVSSAGMTWVSVEEHEESRPLDREGKPLWRCKIALNTIQPPLGWESVYTITAKDKAMAERVVNEWFKRGIVVWQSHDLGSSMGKAFTPVTEGDKPNSPHWQYTGNPVEIISAEDCPRIFSVEYEEEGKFNLPSFYKADEQKEYDKKRKAEVVRLRKEGWTVTYNRHTFCWDIYRVVKLFTAKED
jgi:hypothetical protein